MQQQGCTFVFYEGSSSENMKGLPQKQAGLGGKKRCSTSNPMAYKYKYSENRAKTKKRNSNDFGLRSPVIRKTK